MNRCKICVMPDTRPDVPFVDGVCAACLSYGNRGRIDWPARKRRLEDLIEAHRNDSGFDCIVPSSGGKDSHYQVLTLLELGARPLVVTATTCHLTLIGRANIDNLARYATTIEVTPNREVRRKLNRVGLRLVGDISWPEHVSIFTTPFRIAAAHGISLIFYGENPQDQYGGPQGSEEAMQLTRRWRSEFGGFLGLRPEDMLGLERLRAQDMIDYQMPGQEELEAVGVEAHFLGQYLPWDSHANAAKAAAAGMSYDRPPSPANWWPWENLDNAQTGVHDYFMFRKYGYGRGCTQISVDIRTGRVERDFALAWVRQQDGLFPEEYAGVHVDAVLERVGLTRDELSKLADQFTNWSLQEEPHEYGRLLKSAPRSVRHWPP